MQKSLLVVLLLIIGASDVQAQISKGSLFLGGRIQYVNEKRTTINSSSEYSSSHLVVSPAVGVALKENMVFGVEFNFSDTERKNDNVELEHNKIIGAGVFLRRYISLGKSFYFFGQGRGGVDFFENKYPLSSPYIARDGYTINLGFYPGISYAINRKIQVETGLNNIVFLDYSRTTESGPSVQKSKTRYFNIGTSLNNPISFNLGTRFIL